MRRLTVQPVGRNLTYLSGHGSRELVTEVCNRRPPVWSNLGRAWCVQPSTAADVIALAELRRYRVTVLPQNDPMPVDRGCSW